MGITAVTYVGMMALVGDPSQSFVLMAIALAIGFMGVMKIWGID